MTRLPTDWHTIALTQDRAQQGFVLVVWCLTPELLTGSKTRPVRQKRLDCLTLPPVTV